MGRDRVCRHRGEEGQAGRLADGLDPASLIILAAFRAWVSRHRAPEAPAPDWRALLRLAEVSPEAAACFDRVMERVRRSMRRPIDVRCCHCPRVGADEEALLAMVSALQAGDRLTALDTLTDWLGPQAAIGALPGALDWAARFAAEGLRPQGAVPPAEVAAAPSGAR